MIYPGHMYGTWIVRECPFVDHESYGLNFLQVSGIAGNIGFVMFTCIGADPRDFVSEACTFMKQKDPKLAAGQIRDMLETLSCCGTWEDGGCRLFSMSSARDMASSYHFKDFISEFASANRQEGQWYVAIEYKWEHLEPKKYHW